MKRAEVGGWVVLETRGELDLYTAPRLQDAIGETLSGGARKILIDLSSLAFMDSSGLGVLAKALKRVQAVDGELALVCGEGPPKKLFAVTGMDRVFDIHPSVAALVER